MQIYFLNCVSSRKLYFDLLGSLSFCGISSARSRALTLTRAKCCQSLFLFVTRKKKQKHGLILLLPLLVLSAILGFSVSILNKICFAYEYLNLDHDIFETICNANCFTTRIWTICFVLLLNYIIILWTIISMQILPP